jgi:NAD(P)-dependent dehydrogenase (short-subunit alcohol dehydrogenase family)
MHERNGVAIVTGAGRGIGQAVATALSRDGIAVAVVARTESQLANTAAAINASGGRAAPIVADVGNHTAATEIVQAAEGQLAGPCEILINAAGITGPVSELAEIDLSGWQAVLDINLTGALALCRAVLPGMRRRGSGRIVNVTSGLAHRIQPGLGAYSASKAALALLSNVMDAENRSHGVRVFTLEPGVVRTEMNESLLSQDRTGVRAGVVDMLERIQADPGYVEAHQSAQLIHLVATGQADDLAGQDCSIYDPTVRSRLSA